MFWNRFYTRKVPTFHEGRHKKRIFYRQAHHEENHCERKVQLFWEFENFRHIFFYQAHWAWIFNSENKIEKRDKPTLLKMMRKLVYSRTNEEINNELQTMRSTQTFLKYKNYAQHINEKILPRKDEWSLLFELRVNCPQTMSIHQTMLRCHFE